MHRQRKAKIVATVGPSSAAPDVLERLFLAGVDVFRMNFSHGERADHVAVHRSLRALERKHGRPIAVLQDLQGPKKFAWGAFQAASAGLPPAMLSRSRAARQSVRSTFRCRTRRFSMRLAPATVF